MLPDFAKLEGGLRCSIAPVWILDPEHMRIIWANSPALELWRASSIDELRSRDMVTGTPKAVIDRTHAVFEKARAGERVNEEWTFMPRGQPVTVSVELSGVTSSDGSFCVLVQAAPLREASAPLRRAIATFRHTAVIAAFLRADGHIWTQNPSAIGTFGERSSWVDWLTDSAQAESLLQQVLQEESGSFLVAVTTLAGPRWHMVTLQALRDPVTGEMGVLANHRDETLRIDAERLAADRGQRIEDLATALAVVEQQRREIIELSAPLLEVAPQTLAVPIIGRLDREHNDALTTKLLDFVSNRGIRRVIIDLTGASGLDEDSARYLLQLIAAVRLLGASPIITGISAASSRALCQSSVELQNVTIRRSLAAGLGLR